MNCMRKLSQICWVSKPPYDCHCPTGPAGAPCIHCGSTNRSHPAASERTLIFQDLGAIFKNLRALNSGGIASQAPRTAAEPASRIDHSRRHDRSDRVFFGVAAASFRAIEWPPTGAVLQPRRFFGDSVKFESADIGTRTLGPRDAV